MHALERKCLGNRNRHSIRYSASKTETITVHQVTATIVFCPWQRINFHSDWKVITVFIGGNDLCDHCTHSVSISEDLTEWGYFLF